MESAKIVALGVVTAVVYGVIHDQVTVRLSIEYFTIAHARVIDSESPTLLGLYWGIAASWWVGLVLGIVLALAARIGSRRKVRARALLKSMLALFAITASVAVVSGAIGYLAGNVGLVTSYGHPWLDVTDDRQAAFVAASFAHTASYAAGSLGALTLVFRIWRGRTRCQPA